MNLPGFAEARLRGDGLGSLSAIGAVAAKLGLRLCRLPVRRLRWPRPFVADPESIRRLGNRIIVLFSATGDLSRRKLLQRASASAGERHAGLHPATSGDGSSLIHTGVLSSHPTNRL